MQLKTNLFVQIQIISQNRDISMAMWEFAHEQPYFKNKLHGHNWGLTIDRR